MGLLGIFLASTMPSTACGATGVPGVGVDVDVVGEDAAIAACGVEMVLLVRSEG